MLMVSSPLLLYSIKAFRSGNPVPVEPILGNSMLVDRQGQPITRYPNGTLVDVTGKPLTPNADGTFTTSDGNRVQLQPQAGNTGLLSLRIPQS